MIDISKLQLSAKNNSLKILAQGTGTLVVPPGSSTPGGNNISEGTTVVAHGYGSTDLMWEVAIANVGGTADNHYITPFWTAVFYSLSSIDSNNLYVTAGERWASVVDAPGFSTTFSYRIFIP